MRTRPDSVLSQQQSDSQHSIRTTQQPVLGADHAPVNSHTNRESERDNRGTDGGTNSMPQRTDINPVLDRNGTRVGSDANSARSDSAAAGVSDSVNTNTNTGSIAVSSAGSNAGDTIQGLRSKCAELYQVAMREKAEAQVRTQPTPTPTPTPMAVQPFHISSAVETSVLYYLYCSFCTRCLVVIGEKLVSE